MPRPDRALGSPWHACGRHRHRAATRRYRSIRSARCRRAPSSSSHAQGGS